MFLCDFLRTGRLHTLGPTIYFTSTSKKRDFEAFARTRALKKIFNARPAQHLEERENDDDRKPFQ